MIVFPLFVNVLGYWISDNLLKKEVFENHEESLKLSFYQEGRRSLYNQRRTDRNSQNRSIIIIHIYINLKNLK